MGICSSRPEYIDRSATLNQQIAEELREQNKRLMQIGMVRVHQASKSNATLTVTAGPLKPGINDRIQINVSKRVFQPLLRPVTHMLREMETSANTSLQLDNNRLGYDELRYIARTVAVDLLEGIWSIQAPRVRLNTDRPNTALAGQIDREDMLKRANTSIIGIKQLIDPSFDEHAMSSDVTKRQQLRHKVDIEISRRVRFMCDNPSSTCKTQARIRTGLQRAHNNLQGIRRVETPPVVVGEAAESSVPMGIPVK